MIRRFQTKDGSVFTDAVIADSHEESLFQAWMMEQGVSVKLTQFISEIGLDPTNKALRYRVVHAIRNLWAVS